jgi:hypothetical protein
LAAVAVFSAVKANCTLSCWVVVSEFKKAVVAATTFCVCASAGVGVAVLAAFPVFPKKPKEAKQTKTETRARGASLLMNSFFQVTKSVRADGWFRFPPEFGQTVAR